MNYLCELRIAKNVYQIRISESHFNRMILNIICLNILASKTTNIYCLRVCFWVAKHAVCVKVQDVTWYSLLQKPLCVCVCVCVCGRVRTEVQF